MAVTTRPETVEQEAPGRRPRWIGWTVAGLAVAVLIGVAAVIRTGSTTEPAGITFSSVQAREAGTAAPATELERIQQMPDGELRDHLFRRYLIRSAAVPTELERFQQMSDDELRQHLVDRGLIPSAAVPTELERWTRELEEIKAEVATATELERFQQMSDDELRQHLVDRGLIPSAAATELEFSQMLNDEVREHLDRGDPVGGVGAMI